MDSIASSDDVAKAEADLSLVFVPLIVSDMLCNVFYGLAFSLIGRYWYVFGLRDHKLNTVAIIVLAILYILIVVCAFVNEIHIGWRGDEMAYLAELGSFAQFTEVVQILPASLSQAVLLYRYYGLSKRRAVTAGMAVLILGALVLVLVMIGLNDSLPPFPTDPASANDPDLKGADWEECYVALQGLIELLLAALLTSHLWTRRKGFQASTDTLLSRLVRLTLANSAIILVFITLQIVSLHIKRGQTTLDSLFASLATPLYGICLLVNLLLRENLRTGAGMSGSKSHSSRGAPGRLDAPTTRATFEVPVVGRGVGGDADDLELGDKRYLGDFVQRTDSTAAETL